MSNIVNQDIEDIHLRISAYHPKISGKRFFITGGTGYIGLWLLKYFLHASKYLNGLEFGILSRNPDAFLHRNPEFAEACNFVFFRGDIRSFDVDLGDYDYVIHGAAEASAALNQERPSELFETIVFGTQRLLEASKRGAVRRHLFLSSGAVYGPQPASVSRVAESWYGGPDISNPIYAYAEAKRAAEMLYAMAFREHGSSYVAARIFSILGPQVPRDRHFAAGNFLEDAIHNKAVQVQGSGKAVRSYIYPTDLIVALLTLLLAEQTQFVYNIGSDEAVSILKLATMISKQVGTGAVQVRNAHDSGWNPGPYVPDITRLRKFHNFDLKVNLDEAIMRTAHDFKAYDLGNSRS